MNIDSFDKVCVIGWGRSGVALCNLLLRLKKKVRISDEKQEKEFPRSPIDEFKNTGVEFEFGGHSDRFIKEAQLIVLSPGVDTQNAAAVKIAQSYGIPFVGEIEFSFWLTAAKIIAISGTNGKTTTTHITHQLLKRKFKRVFLGGNIGVPFSSFVMKVKKNDLVVLEVSSFQLETIVEFRPHVCALLNIEPDHLDRYAQFDDYVKAKLNIFKNQNKEDWAVLNKKIDAGGFRNKINAKIVWFSRECSNENFSCAYKIAGIFGVAKSECERFFSKFKGLPHRMQFVRKLRGVGFINDSKATNPASTIWALTNIKSPVILIAGGKDKGVDFFSITPYLANVRKVFLFGEACQRINRELSPCVQTQIVSSINESVVNAFCEAKAGDTVILSPMCSSFDMFANYEERGSKFMEIVNAL